MQSNKRHLRTWFRFRLWEAIVFTSLVAALFGVGRMIDFKVHDFPDAPHVSLTFAKAEIARGNVVFMNLRQADDLVVAYAGLSAPVTVADQEETSTQNFVVAMRRSDGSAPAVLELLESQGVPFSLFRSTRAFSLTFPLVGAGLLTLAAVVLLRLRNRPSQHRTPTSDT